MDVQTTRRQEVLTADVVRAVPATRGYNAILAMIPSVNTSAFFNAGEQNNTQLSPGMTIFTSHGGRGNEGRVQVDGLNVGAAFNGGGVSGYIMDTAGAQELQFTLSGGLGEAETGGINLNIVPKTGGNRFAGEFFTSAAGKWSQSDNVDDSLRRSASRTAGIVKNWDVNASVGGPIKRDRLWFYANVRDFGTHRVVPGAFGNLNAGDATKWTYVEDRSQEIRNDSAETLGSIRLTAQVTPRNKVGFFIDQQRQCTGSALAKGGEGWCRDRANEWVALGGLFTSPEADAIAANRSPQRVMQATWSSTATSKLLLEAGFSSYISRWGWMETPGAITNLIPVTTIVPTFKTFRGLDNYFYNHQSANVWRASASYVTGRAQREFGYQGAYHIEDIDDRGNQNEHHLHVHLSGRVRHAVSVEHADAADRALADQQPDRVRVVLRTGSMDHGAADAARGLAIRSVLQLPSGGQQRIARQSLASGAHHVPRNGRRARLQGLYAARRCGDRSLRQRQDVSEGEHRKIPRVGQQPGQLSDQQSGLRRTQRPVRGVSFQRPDDPQLE